jgi:hypothetical protein
MSAAPTGKDGPPQHGRTSLRTPFSSSTLQEVPAGMIGGPDAIPAVR